MSENSPQTPEPSVLARIGPTPAQPARSAGEEVALENQSASRLTTQDARWAFAVRVASSIGAGGIVRPEVRRRLMAQAGQLGLEGFDASLVIAIVQQGARSKGDGPLGPTTQRRVELVPVRARGSSRGYRTRVLLSLSFGVAWFVLLVLWLVR